jgi:predicted DNA-binding transcriptional regulator AlpA
MCKQAPSPFLTVKEAAHFLRLKPRTLDDMRCQGTGPKFRKHGGRIVYHLDDLIEWSERSRRRSTSDPDSDPDPDSDTDAHPDK